MSAYVYPSWEDDQGVTYSAVAGWIVRGCYVMRLACGARVAVNDRPRARKQPTCVACIAKAGIPDREAAPWYK